MCFKCEECQVVQPKGEPSFRISVQHRESKYPFREKANRDGSDDPGGEGMEIVKEKRMCFECAFLSVNK